MLLYDLKLPKDILGYSTIQADLRRKGKHDPGAGSTLAVLERRGLVLVVHDEMFVPLVGMVPRIRVRVTTAGRAAARAGRGTTAPTRPPLFHLLLHAGLSRRYPRIGQPG
jgi:hypothetical protein